MLGKVILITGASSGIGQACAKHLANLGYIVYGTSRFEPNLKIEGQKYKMIQMDITSEDSIKLGIKKIFDSEGRLDIVINNAGFAIAGSIEDTSVEEAQCQFETNFIGVLKICHTVLPLMREQGSGYLINISSIAGLMGIPFHGFYSASKFALEGLSEALSMELNKFNIQVILVEAGDTKTKFTANRIKIKGKNICYKNACERAVSIMEGDERNGSNPHQVALLVEKILSCKRPKLRYTVGPISQRLAVYLKRILPGRFFERIIMFYYKL